MSRSLRKPQFGGNPTGPVENAEPGNSMWKQQGARGLREKRGSPSKRSWSRLGKTDWVVSCKRVSKNDSRYRVEKQDSGCRWTVKFSIKQTNEK